MMNQILAVGLTAGAKAGCKIGSKVICYAAGTVLGYGISKKALTPSYNKMEKFMSEKYGEAWNKAKLDRSLITPEMQKDLDRYNLKVTAMNGLCNGVGAVASAFADVGLCKVIDKSSLSGGSNFTIGNRFTI